MAKRKPRQRYSRSFIVDFFEAMHGNTKPCVDAGCPITVALNSIGRRISISEATTLDSELTRAFDGYCRTNFNTSTEWEQLSAAEIVRITRGVMAEAT